MPRTYAELCEAFPLRTIGSDEHLTAAIAALDGLLKVLHDREHSPDEDDYLDDLGNLIHAYEEVYVKPKLERMAVQAGLRGDITGCDCTP